MKFAKIKNGELVEVIKTEHDKPNGVFWMSKLNNEWRESKGYYVVIEKPYNPFYQSKKIELVDGIPTEVITDLELDLEEEKAKKIENKRLEIRSRIDSLVKEDVQKKIFDPTHIIPQEIVSGREVLKAEFDAYEVVINACTTLEELSHE